MMRILFRLKRELERCFSARVSMVFVLYVIVAVVSLLLSNIVVVKSFSFFNIAVGGYNVTITSSVIVFPLIYICSDIFSEVYGYTWSRIISWLGFLMNILMAVIFEVTILLPGNDAAVSTAFETILGSSFGILSASLIAYMCGDLLNDIVFEYLKRNDSKKTSGRIIFRSLISSFCGEIIDTGVFLPTLFLLTGQFGTTIRSISQLAAIILIQASLKVVMELILSPLTIFLVHKTRSYEERMATIAT